MQTRLSLGQWPAGCGTVWRPRASHQPLTLWEAEPTAPPLRVPGSGRDEHMVGTDGRGRASPPGTAFCIPHRLGTTSADLGRPCCRPRSRGPSRGLTWPAGSPAPASWNPSALGPRPPALSSAEQSLAPRPTGQRPVPPVEAGAHGLPHPRSAQGPPLRYPAPTPDSTWGTGLGDPFLGCSFLTHTRSPPAALQTPLEGRCVSRWEGRPSRAPAPALPLAQSSGPLRVPGRTHSTPRPPGPRPAPLHGASLVCPPTLSPHPGVRNTLVPPARCSGEAGSGRLWAPGGAEVGADGKGAALTEPHGAALSPGQASGTQGAPRTNEQRLLSGASVPGASCASWASSPSPVPLPGSLTPPSPRNSTRGLGACQGGASACREP